MAAGQQVIVSKTNGMKFSMPSFVSSGFVGKRFFTRENSDIIDVNQSVKATAEVRSASEAVVASREATAAKDAAQRAEIEAQRAAKTASLKAQEAEKSAVKAAKAKDAII